MFQTAGNVFETRNLDIPTTTAIFGTDVSILPYKC